MLFFSDLCLHVCESNQGTIFFQLPKFKCPKIVFRIFILFIIVYSKHFRCVLLYCCIQKCLYVQSGPKSSLRLFDLKNSTKMTDKISTTDGRVSEVSLPIWKKWLRTFLMRFNRCFYLKNPWIFGIGKEITLYLINYPFRTWLFQFTR